MKIFAQIASFLHIAIDAEMILREKVTLLWKSLSYELRLFLGISNINTKESIKLRAII